MNYSNLESESFRCILIKILVMFTASPGYPALPPSPPLPSNRSSPPSLSLLSSHTPIHLFQTPDSLSPTHPPASLPAQSHPSVVPPCTAGILRSNFSDRATEGSEYLVYALTGIRLELFGVRAVRQTKVEQRQTMLCCIAICLSLSLPFESGGRRGRTSRVALLWPLPLFFFYHNIVRKNSNIFIDPCISL